MVSLFGTRAGGSMVGPPPGVILAAQTAGGKSRNVAIGTGRGLDSASFGDTYTVGGSGVSPRHRRRTDQMQPTVKRLFGISTLVLLGLLTPGMAAPARATCGDFRPLKNGYDSY